MTNFWRGEVIRGMHMDMYRLHDDRHPYRFSGQYGMDNGDIEFFQEVICNLYQEIFDPIQNCPSYVYTTIIERKIKKNLKDTRDSILQEPVCRLFKDLGYTVTVFGGKKNTYGCNESLRNFQLNISYMNPEKNIVNDYWGADMIKKIAKLQEKYDYVFEDFKYFIATNDRRNRVRLSVIEKIQDIDMDPEFWQYVILRFLAEEGEIFSLYGITTLKYLSLYNIDLFNLMPLKMRREFLDLGYYVDDDINYFIRRKMEKKNVERERHQNSV